MSKPARILLVEDEAYVRQGLEKILVQSGYEVTGVASGEEALKLVQVEKFDLALLDLKLKGIDGTEVLKQMRAISPDTVAIVLTAHASLETAVKALRLGAHDYLFKPCSPVELRESVHRGLQVTWQRGLLRQLDNMTGQLDNIRSALVDWQTVPPPSPREEIQKTGRFLQRGNIVIDFMRHLITIDGYLLDLSLTEFELFVYLVEQAPRVISVEELLEHVHGYDTDGWEANRLARQYIYRLRQKIKEVTGQDNMIQTVRGVGYHINIEAL